MSLCWRQSRRGQVTVLRGAAEEQLRLYSLMSAALGIHTLKIYQNNRDTAGFGALYRRNVDTANTCWMINVLHSLATAPFRLWNTWAEYTDGESADGWIDCHMKVDVIGSETICYSVDTSLVYYLCLIWFPKNEVMLYLWPLRGDSTGVKKKSDCM